MIGDHRAAVRVGGRRPRRRYRHAAVEDVAWAGPAPSSGSPRRPVSRVTQCRAGARARTCSCRALSCASRLRSARRTASVPSPPPHRRGTVAGHSAPRTRRSSLLAHGHRAELDRRRRPGSPRSSARHDTLSLRSGDAHASARAAPGHRRRSRMQQLRPPDRRSGHAGSRRRGARRGRHVLRHGGHLRRRGRERGVPRPGAAGPARPSRAGDEVRQADGRRRDAARARGLHPPRARGVAADGCRPT